MYGVHIRVSTGAFHATFANLGDVRNAVTMVASGAEVSQGWTVTLHDDTTGATVTGDGKSVTGMYDAVNALLSALSSMPPRPLRLGEGVDVIVPVRLAMHGGQLVDAEDFVRGAVERALNDDAAAETVGMLGNRPEFSFNGDTVTPGSAKKDRS